MTRKCIICHRDFTPRENYVYICSPCTISVFRYGKYDAPVNN